ncbi:type II secretion system F family protein [Anthocerotibacter panamensis]|uniref:type II secretion system F family protein n=1 Tax=Anthocerotibacter panamensis TaxID=2857077 RepID=UPI001C405F9C|nr:type II secretion system F family protein [Anthocerotibacter panamensis]
MTTSQLPQKKSTPWWETEFVIWTKKDTIAFLNSWRFGMVSGLSMVEVLQDLLDVSTATKDVGKAQIYQKMLRQAQAGQPCAQALLSFPKWIPPEISRLILIAEGQGEESLKLALRDIASTLKDNGQILGKIVGPIIYGASLFLLSFGSVVIVAQSAVEPQLQVLGTYDYKPRFPVFALIAGLLQSIGQNWLYMLGGLGLVVGGFLYLISTPVGRYNLDRVMLSTPYTRDLWQVQRWGLFLRVLLILIRSGVPLDQAVDGARSGLGAYLGQAIGQLPDWIRAIDSGTGGTDFSIKKFFSTVQQARRIPQEVRRTLCFADKGGVTGLFEPLEEQYHVLLEQGDKLAESTAFIWQLVGLLPAALLLTATIYFFTAFGEVLSAALA